MYEKYTRQSLPERKYRELLGSALCVFNSNNAFIIENILKDNNIDTTWRYLIDQESGKLEPFLLERLDDEGELGQQIIALFKSIVDKRNRIIHGFQVTDKDGRQILATKERENRGGRQFHITEEFLHDFIKDNETLSVLLHQLRGY